MKRLSMCALAALSGLPLACSDRTASLPALPVPAAGPATTLAEPTPTEADASAIVIDIDTTSPGDEISPYILGLSGDLPPDDLDRAGITLGSWGGNPATRFNYEVGNAWNHGSDYEFRNTDYDQDGDVARRALTDNAAAGLVTRFAIPTLGWVAADSDPERCSFPDDQGGCTGGAGFDCANPGPIADPERANVPSTSAMVASWLSELVAEGLAPEYIAMDNEPDLWGYTHYDVHPSCTTYEEIRDRYVEYADAVAAVAPDAQLMGPAVCCWFEYWGNAPGPADGSGQEFVSWFLDQVAAHDAETGERSLDALDVHYYPQSDVYNDDVDPETNARRLRSTRALWDTGYVDESWIDRPVYFIPRLQTIIEEHYPDTPLFISEWNFGGDADINGALVIADVLGIYGREGVDGAAYWRNPPAGSPGVFGFAMHGNYDGQGTRFGGRVLPVTSSSTAKIAAFAALDEEAGVVRLMLINKDPDEDHDVTIDGVPAGTADRFTYGPADLGSIVADRVDTGATLTLGASTITVLELAP